MAYTLNNPKLIEDDKLLAFDVVIANPPFSLDKWGAENASSDKHKRFHRGIPPKGTGDWAFITHMIETARKKVGRVAVVIPLGVLFRGGQEGKIRKKIIEENLLDAVIGLPSNLFQSTAIPVAILVIDRRREVGGPFADRENILFIDASREFQPAKSQHQLLEGHINQLLMTFNSRADMPKYARSVPIKEIEANGYNLNIPLYVDTFEAEEIIDITGIQKEIETLEAELMILRQEMKIRLNELSNKSAS